MAELELYSKLHKIIAVDFDGTLCENAFPEIGVMKSHVIDFIKRQAESGAKIILNTCRENGNRALLDEAVAFCEAQGITLYAVNENPDNTQYDTKARKVYADLYIDDKAVRPNEIEEIIIQEKFAKELEAAIEKL